LFGIIGRKGRVGGHASLDVKSLLNFGDGRLETACLESCEGEGIPSVGVKSVDIRKNTGGEGELLAHN
jgi:hypothetical protein